MGKQSKIISGKPQHSSTGRNILWCYFAVFFVLGIRDLIALKLTAADYFTAVLFLGILLLAGRKYKITAVTAVFLGLVFVPHTIGNLGGYTSSILNYQFDKLVHLSTAFLATLAITLFLLNNSKLKLLHIILIAMFVTISFGAAIEMSEYWGFIYIGYGSGYLGFGAGDNSKNFGPWEDSSLDTTFNFLGSFIGAFASFILIWIRKNDYPRFT